MIFTQTFVIIEYWLLSVYITDSSRFLFTFCDLLSFFNYRRSGSPSFYRKLLFTAYGTKYSRRKYNSWLSWPQIFICPKWWKYLFYLHETSIFIESRRLFTHLEKNASKLLRFKLPEVSTENSNSNRKKIIR